MKAEYPPHDQHTPSSSNAHIMSAMKGESKASRKAGENNSSRKNSDKGEDATGRNGNGVSKGSDAAADRGRALGAGTNEKNGKAPQISPMKPLSPMGSVDMGLGMNLGFD